MPNPAAIRLLATLLSVAPVAAVACSDSLPTADPAPEGVTVAAGWRVTEVVSGLDRPTQIALADDGRLLVAQLAGAEGDGTGQVVAIDLDQPDQREVVVDGLDKPTGVAEVDGVLWVMEERTLSAGPDGENLEVVLDDLPFNGRSEGTLTPTGDGGLYYATTGNLDGGRPAAGSGVLWRIDASGEPEQVADGFKNAYAHVVDGDGQLWATEIGDGRYDGRSPPDELVAVAPGDRFGWPACIGDGEPVAEYGGDEAGCRATPRSHTLFEPGATPTSVAVAPWDADTLVVALWNRGQVVSVPRPADDGPHRAAGSLLEGIDHPQHLLADGDRLLVVDHDGGRILALTRT